MDSLLVFRRTEAGDDLVKHPRKIKRVEWRAALLLVDGHLPVRELKRRFGESLQIEDVLEALLAEGLIEPVSPETGNAFPDDLPEPRDPSWLSEMEAALNDDAPMSIPPAPETEPAHAFKSPAPKAAPTPPPVASAPPTTTKAADDDEEAPVKEKKARFRGPRTSINVGKLLTRAIGIAVVGGAAAAAFVLPAKYQPEIEEAMGHAFNTTARIEKTALTFAGGPALELRGVQLEDKQGLTIPRMLLRPDYRNFVGSLGKAIDVQLPDLTLTPTQLVQLTENTQPLRRVTRITLGRLVLKLGAYELPPLGGVVRMDGAEGPLIQLSGTDGGARFSAHTSALGLDFEMFAEEWPLPVLGGFKSTGMQIEGRLTDQLLEISHFGAAAKGGRIEGSVRALFGEEILVEGVLRTAGVETESVLFDFDPASTSRGVIDGDFSFIANGKSFAALRAIRSLKGSFEVNRGTFGGIDIPLAMRERQPDPVTGGTTSFDKLTGALDYTPEGGKLTVIHLDAGSMTGSGNLQLRHDGGYELSGLMNLTVTSNDRNVRAPVEFSGSLATPKVRVSAVSVSR